MESFGRLREEEGYEFIDDLGTHAAGAGDGVSMTLNRGFKERHKVTFSGYSGGHIAKS